MKPVIKQDRWIVVKQRYYSNYIINGKAYLKKKRGGGGEERRAIILLSALNKFYD
jgi:hypothetical protein